MHRTLRNDYRVYEESIRREMLPFVPDNSKSILDVGCSVGNFGEILKNERGADVWGVEPDAEAARLAAGRLDRVLCSYFDLNLDIEGRRFDCIVFNDVLEHMVDPYSALDLARNLLTPDGVVVASIPNVRYFGNMWLLLVHGSWEYTDVGILDRTHLRFFTKKSINSMFCDHGYRIDTLEGINPVEDHEPWFATKFQVLNMLSFSAIRDMRWLQFAVVASAIDTV